MWLLSALDLGVKEHLPFPILVFVDQLPIQIPRKIVHMAPDRLRLLNLLFSRWPSLGICCVLPKIANKRVFRPPESNVHGAAFPQFQSHNVKVKSPLNQTHVHTKTCAQLAQQNKTCKTKKNTGRAYQAKTNTKTNPRTKKPVAREQHTT